MWKNVVEFPQATPCKVVHGRVPPGLRGTYFKASPGIFTQHGSHVRHPLDGAGFVMSLELDGLKNAALYRARVVRTRHYVQEQRAGLRIFSGAFGTHGLLQACSVNNTANTSVFPFGRDEVLACFDGGLPYRLDARSLETLGPLPGFGEGLLPIETGLPPLDGALRAVGVAGDVLNAHPKLVPCAAGEPRLAFFGLKYGPRLDASSRSVGIETRVSFYEVCPATKHAERLPAELRLDGVVYAHDFAATEDAFVFFEQPQDIDVSGLLPGRTFRGIANSLSSSKEKRARIHVVPRRASAEDATEPPTTVFTAAAEEAMGAFAFHHVVAAATREPPAIHVASIRYPRYFVTHNLASEIPAPSLVVSTLTQAQGEFSTRTLTGPKHMEFPCLLRDAPGQGQYQQEQRFFSCILSSDARPFRTVATYGLHDGLVHDSWTSPYDSSWLGEPCELFPASDRGSFTAVMCYTRGSTHLLLFETHRLSAGPLCAVQVPDVLPPVGLHGCWAPAAAAVDAAHM